MCWCIPGNASVPLLYSIVIHPGEIRKHTGSHGRFHKHESTQGNRHPHKRIRIQKRGTFMIGYGEILEGMQRIGVRSGMELEVHSSLRSFGPVDGGAETVIRALKDSVGPNGSLFMPALRLSPDLQKTAEDVRLGITYKARILSPDEPRSAMGLIADTFRLQPDVIVGDGVFATAAWGRNADKAASCGFQHLIDHGGMALMLGVDIYRLTAMHYVEDLLPQRVRDIFKPSDAVTVLYPPDAWFVETGTAPVKAWYTIQDRAFKAGLIRTGHIGDCAVMFFPVADVVGLYAQALRRDALGLYGLA